MSETINPFGHDIIKLETEFCGQTLSIETGRLAFLADGAVTVRYGDTVVLGTAVVDHKPRAGADFFPMMVDYEEKMYAAGKISGSRFIKREGRASDHATLAARLIDRPIRPLFPKGFRNEVQAVATVLSTDSQYSTETLGITAVSTALMLSGAPFEGPVAGVKVGLVDDELVAFPNAEQMQRSRLDLTVAGTEDAIMMVEAGAHEVDEDTMLQALELAHEAIQPLIKLQKDLREQVQPQAMEYELAAEDEELQHAIADFLSDKLGPAIRHESRWERHKGFNNLKEATFEHFASKHPDKFEHAHIEAAFEEAIKADVRAAILDEHERPDKRKPSDIRDISCEVGMLPRTHGSGLFTRGTTQVLNITTLASPGYAQIIDTMEEDDKKHFMHHYNFPGFSTGEVRPMRGPGRREIGHGALAERGLEAVIPSQEDFPYVIRTVSEVMTSNGSTSMGSVCAATLSLMDAGVPIQRPVSGIAMGLMMSEDGSDYEILSDIAGEEDFAGDMDFKVAGSREGITALQMDIKIKGLTTDILKAALERAREGRLHILEEMLKTIDAPRQELNAQAPRIIQHRIDPAKIGNVIGKGGETIQKIVEDTGAQVDIDDDGTVHIAGEQGNAAGAEAALDTIKELTEDPEVGTIYEGKVVKVMEYGAFVEISPGKDGLLHISELDERHIDDIHNELQEGDTVRVKLIAVDDMGRLKLSKKQAQA